MSPVVVELRARTWAESVALRELAQLRAWSPPKRRADRTNPKGRVVVLAGERPPASADWFVVEHVSVSGKASVVVRRRHQIDPASERILRGPFTQADAVATLPPLAHAPIGRPRRKAA